MIETSHSNPWRRNELSMKAFFESIDVLKKGMKALKKAKHSSRDVMAFNKASVDLIKHVPLMKKAINDQENLLGIICWKNEEHKNNYLSLLEQAKNDLSLLGEMLDSFYQHNTQELLGVINRIIDELENLVNYDISP